MALTRRLIHAALLGAFALGAHAQDKTPLKIVVGFPPGGSADTLARLIGEQMRATHDPVVV